MEWHEPALCCDIQIQINSLEHSTTGELHLLDDNTSITNQEVPVLLSATANFIGQLSSILTK